MIGDLQAWCLCKRSKNENRIVFNKTKCWTAPNALLKHTHTHARIHTYVTNNTFWSNNKHSHWTNTLPLWVLSASTNDICIFFQLALDIHVYVFVCRYVWARRWSAFGALSFASLQYACFVRFVLCCSPFFSRFFFLFHAFFI